MGTRSITRAWNRRMLRQAYLERQLRLSRMVAFAMAIAAVLFLLCAQAHAAGLDGGAPTDAGAPDAGFLDVPVELRRGTPAPFDGWEISEARAQQLVRNADAQEQANADAQTAAGPAEAPGGSGCPVLLVGAVTLFALGVFAGAYVAVKLK